MVVGDSIVVGYHLAFAFVGLQPMLYTVLECLVPDFLLLQTSQCHLVMFCDRLQIADLICRLVNINVIAIVF